MKTNMSLNYFFKIITVSIVIVIFLSLVFISNENYSSDRINFLAILIGGYISGSLTLAGVLLTLNQQDNERILREMPILRIKSPFDSDPLTKYHFIYYPQIALKDTSFKKYFEKLIIKGPSYTKSNTIFLTFSNIGKSPIKHLDIENASRWRYEKYLKIDPGEEYNVSFSIVIDIDTLDKLIGNREEEIFLKYYDYQDNLYYTKFWVSISYNIISGVYPKFFDQEPPKKISEDDYKKIYQNSRNNIKGYDKITYKPGMH